MTIAMCYMSPEGVVLGADSTSSALVPDGSGAAGYHYLNYNQKLFQLGEESSIGALTWGLGGLTNLSHRTMLAQVADLLSATPPTSVSDVANLLAGHFWTAYSADPAVGACKGLAAKTPYAAGAAPSAGMRTEQEERNFARLTRGLVVGFCVAGYWKPDRTPSSLSGLALRFSSVRIASSAK